MQTSLPTEIIQLANLFEQKGYSLYIVGGPVRDLLLGIPLKDWDFTTNANPEKIIEITEELSSEHFSKPFYNNKFGTVGVPLVPKENTENTNQIIEITTMRKEGEYKDHRHPIEVGWTEKIEEDLGRRDFTMNAMAIKLDTQQIEKLREQNNLLSLDIIDPFNGHSDITNRTIKAVGNPINRFEEDALRMMRAIRFSSQLDFSIEEKTLQAIIQRKELIKKIAWERIRDELWRLLSTQYPYEGITILKDVGILEIILPELTRTFGIVQEGPKHDRIYDIGIHCLLSLKHCPSNDPLVRFATMLHDIGKYETYKIAPDGNVTFYNHEVVGANTAKQICRRFNLSNEQTDKIYRLIRWHMFTLSETQTDSAVRRFITNVGIENVDDMMALRVGDRLGGGTQKAVSWRMEKFRERIDEVMTKPFSITDLKINGKDIMETLNMKPGSKIGEILNKLFAEVLEDDEKNNREYLLKRLSEL